VVVVVDNPGGCGNVRMKRCRMENGKWKMEKSNMEKWDGMWVGQPAVVYVQ
jgi:hypothetical protein